MIFATFYIQKHRHATNFVSNEAFVGKKEVKILKKFWKLMLKLFHFFTNLIKKT